MTTSTRKLIGTLMMIALVIVYPLAGMVAWATWFTGAVWWIAIGYALVVGLGWAIPAAIIIRWMVRPAP